MANYIALIRKEKDSIYGVDFPDFPGCISADKTLDDAVEMGREALQAHIAFMLEEGDVLPKPTGLEEILNNPENREGLVLAFLVTVPEPASAK